MKKLLSLATLLTLAALPAFAADIKIGLAGSMTGDNAFFGDQMKHGAEMAVADINRNGGINGQKLALEIADDACDPKQSVSVANKLMSQGVKFVIGHTCSASSIPALKAYSEEGVFMITPVSTNPAITETGYGNIFRTCGRDDQQGSVIGKYLMKNFQGKKIAVAHDNSAWGLGLANEVKKTLNNANVKEVLFESFPPDGRDYAPFISRLKQNSIDVVFLGGYHKAVGLITRQMKEQNAPMQIVGGDAIFTKDFWGITGNAGEGVLMSYAPDMRKKPEAHNVVEAFRKNAIDPEGYTLNTYAAVQVVAEGLKRANATDPTKVSAAIREKPVSTVIGSLGYDKKGDVQGTNFVVYRWHNGDYAEVSE